MKRPTAAEALFSAKSFGAAMLALYISMRIGLPRPFWSMMTAYIVSAPFAGPTRSKALYRFAGTFLGAAATVVLVPQLANAPELLSLALALWVGGCLYVSLLDRTPRSYVLMLAGYTAALIAFPVVDQPATMFDVALARVEEILLGLTCATLVHTLILPQSFGPVLLARLNHTLGDARQWIADALCGQEADSARDRRKLAADITELRLMSTHLPFDTSHLRFTVDTVHALQDQLSLMMPLLSAIDDRRRALDDTTLARWQPLLDALRAWSAAPALDAASLAALHARIDALTPAAPPDADWDTLLQANLALRLHALVDAYARAQQLREAAEQAHRGTLPPTTPQPAAGASDLHLDRGLALMSALAAVLCIFGSAMFWILTAWPAGSIGPMMAAVMCCFFAAQDDPARFIKSFLFWTVLSIPLAAFYLLVVLPAVHSFEMLALACAPLFLVLGVFIARPATYGKAMPLLFGVATTLAMLDTQTADMVSFLNITLGQVLGIGAAATMTQVFRSVGAGWVVGRLLQSGWRELAGVGRGQLTPTISAFTARMLDRIAQLTPRLAAAGRQQDQQATDALNDLRVGLNMVQLQQARAELGAGQAALRVLLSQLADHFAARPAATRQADAALLSTLDGTLRAVSTDSDSAPRTRVLAALTGIRRDLFPAAAPYAP